MHPLRNVFRNCSILAILLLLAATTTTCLALEPHLRFKIAASVAKGERRALERQAQRRVLCNRCNRPPIQCVCDVLPDRKIETTNTDVLILQHPTEFRRKTFSTVPLLPLVLANVQISVGNSFDPKVVRPIREAIANGKKLLLLFPSEDAIDLDQLSSSEKNDDANSSPASNVLGSNETSGNLLILIDGTWTQAARMIRYSPDLLDCCQKVQFTSSQKSIYDQIRKEPAEHCLSTLEACAQTLRLLEPESEDVRQAERCLLAALKKLVDGHLIHSAHGLPRFVSRGGDKAEAKEERWNEVETKLFGSVSGFREEERPKPPPSNSRTIQLTAGAILRPLSIRDADWIDEAWPDRSRKSRMSVRWQLRNPQCECCLGIEMDGKLRACLLRYNNGALGMLHVDPDVRRRGYATALIQEAVRILELRGEAAFVYIREGNEASEALFRKLGWMKEEEESGRPVKNNSGYRRANRQWKLPR